MHLTIAGLVDGFFAYGIIHAGWHFVHFIIRQLLNRLGSERDKILRAHIQERHRARFKKCQKGSCIILGMFGQRGLKLLQATRAAGLL